MPLFINDTLALRARMSTLQFGALQSLRLNAWSEKPPCTLPDNDGALAAMSGLSAEEWAASAFVLRRFLTPTDGDASGPRLIDLELQKLYHKQFAKYMTAKLRGERGGRPKAAKEAAKNQPEKVGESPGFVELSNHLNSGLKSGSVEKTDGPEAWGKPELPERQSAPELTRRQNEWLAANPGKRLPLTFHAQPPAVKPTKGPYAEADEYANSEAARQRAEEAGFDAEYELELLESAERWRNAGHDREYLVHWAEVVKQRGYFNDRDIPAEVRGEIEATVARRLRDELHWDSLGQYVIKRRRAKADRREAVSA